MRAFLESFLNVCKTFWYNVTKKRCENVVTTVWYNVAKKRYENVVTTFSFGCEKVSVKRLWELLWKVFLMFAKRFGTTLQKTHFATFLQPFLNHSPTFPRPSVTFLTLKADSHRISILIQMLYFHYSEQIQVMHRFSSNLHILF